MPWYILNCQIFRSCNRSLFTGNMQKERVSAEFLRGLLSQTRAGYSGIKTIFNRSDVWGNILKALKYVFETFIHSDTDNWSVTSFWIISSSYVENKWLILLMYYKKVVHDIWKVEGIYFENRLPGCAINVLLLCVV